VEFPKLYAIVDRGTLDSHGVGVQAFAEELREGGVRLVQYRDKVNGPQEVLRACREIAEVFAGVGATLILNDRADLAALAGWGVHVGQGDLGVGDVRRVLGLGEGLERGGRGGFAEGEVFGVSTHTVEQVIEVDEALRGAGMGGSGRAERAMPGSENPDPGHPDSRLMGESIDPDSSVGGGMTGPDWGPGYIAVGPVFGTRTKLDAEAVVGLEGVRRARALTGRPLVAIGGIGLGNFRSVLEAGADSVAVISGLFVEGRRVSEVAREFLGDLG
jgi:thiamine-phosphate pyrophosphorylase